MHRTRGRANMHQHWFHEKKFHYLRFLNNSPFDARQYESKLYSVQKGNIKRRYDDLWSLGHLVSFLWFHELTEWTRGQGGGLFGIARMLHLLRRRGVSERRNLWLCCLERSWRGLQDLDLEWAIGAGETKDVLRGCSNSSKLLTSSWTWLGGVREREARVVDDPVVSHLRQL